VLSGDQCQPTGKLEKAQRHKILSFMALQAASLPLLDPALSCLYLWAVRHS
jgi:hypothetical protein